MRTASSLLGLFALLLADSASAQVCPAGARGTPYDEPGPNGYCAPYRCRTDADCDAGMRCAALPMCISSLRTGGRRVETAWHACDRGTPCNANERCENARLCVDGPSPPPPTAPLPAPPPSPPAPPTITSVAPTAPPERAHGMRGCTTVPGVDAPLAPYAALALLIPVARRRRP